MDLSAVNFVIAPARFPKHQPYVLVRDDAYVPDTPAFLRAFAPRAPFHGFVPPSVRVDEVYPLDAVVVSSDRWYAAVARLLENGFPPGRVHVLLNTYNDAAGYLEVGRTCPDHMAELADPAVPVGRKAVLMRPHLLRYGAANRFDGDDPVWAPEHYFTAFRDLVRANAGAVHDVTARLADAESRAAYQAVLYGTPDQLLEYFLARVFREQQYVEVARLAPGDVIVNAGIGSGWDVPYLVAGNRGRGRHILIDPLRLLKPDGPCGHLVDRLGLEFAECGLWDRTDELTFPVDRSGMVHSDKPGGTLPGGRVHRTPLRRLDDLVPEWGLDRLDLVKMDIEGADLRALYGMRDTLTRFRPQLAACLYHDPEHMWVIPSLLMDWLPGYRFYVRHYSYTRFECLLYAIPAEREAAAVPAPATLAGRCAAAGVDLGIVGRTWGRLVPGVRFDAAAGRLGGAPGAVVRAAEAELDRAYQAADEGRPAPVTEVEAGDDRLLGTGWDREGENHVGQRWRWVGADGEASVYLALDPGKDHLCRFYFHHVETQAGFDEAALEVDGAPAGEREIGSNGTYFYAQWRIPAAALAARAGRCRLRFRTAPGRRQTAVAMVHCWQAA